VLAIGTRLQDFTTGSWTIFRNEKTKIVAINAARLDAFKHFAVPVVGDARETLTEMSALLGDYSTSGAWQKRAVKEAAGFAAYLASIQQPNPDSLPTYAQVVGAVARQATPADYALTAAGGFPGELINGWPGLSVGSFDTEYGFSCMGYELSGAWGARMARADGEVYAFVGDGSYMMMNSDLYSSVLSGHKVTALVCDNGGFAVINRLQIGQGGVPFNNLLADCRVAEHVKVDFAAHAAAMGCRAEKVTTIAEFSEALARARANDRSSVIVIETDPYMWTEGGAFWEVAVPEVSARQEVLDAKAAMTAGLLHQRQGW
jgi:3D-(3,5/4)-trihydroxycyclohexane-1,2-dione acylhydrolase (decyclizing)